MAPKKPLMRVIALAATKGGVGKSTLTASLAVRAAEESRRVAIVDQDPQLSLSSWHDRRGNPSNPQLFEYEEGSHAGLELIASQGWEYLFLDTPPSQIDIIEPVIASSDFILIPTRAGIYDLEAISVTEELCLEHEKPYAFILNMVTNKAASAAAATHLREGKRVLLEPFISQRQSHVTAALQGKTAPEMKDAAAKAEIDALWLAVKQAVTKATTKRRAA